MYLGNDVFQRCTVKSCGLSCNRTTCRRTRQYRCSRRVDSSYNCVLSVACTLPRTSYVQVVVSEQEVRTSLQQTPPHCSPLNSSGDATTDAAAIAATSRRADAIAASTCAGKARQGAGRTGKAGECRGRYDAWRGARTGGRASPASRVLAWTRGRSWRAGREAGASGGGTRPAPRRGGVPHVAVGAASAAGAAQGAMSRRCDGDGRGKRGGGEGEGRGRGRGGGEGGAVVGRRVGVAGAGTPGGPHPRGPPSPILSPSLRRQAPGAPPTPAPLPPPGHPLTHLSLRNLIGNVNMGKWGPFLTIGAGDVRYN